MIFINESVILSVWLYCVRCKKTITRKEIHDNGDCVRTGTMTEMASNSLLVMRNEIIAEASNRRWEMHDKGYVCTHCIAEEVDK